MALEFEVALPPVPADVRPGQIDHGLLNVIRTLNGEEIREGIRTERDQSEVKGITGDVNSSVTLAFQYVDGAGNMSVVPSVFEGTLVDNFPPPNPGELGIRVTGEV